MTPAKEKRDPETDVPLSITHYFCVAGRVGSKMEGFSGTWAAGRLGRVGLGEKGGRGRRGTQRVFAGDRLESLTWDTAEWKSSD